MDSMLLEGCVPPVLEDHLDLASMMPEESLEVE